MSSVPTQGCTNQVMSTNKLRHIHPLASTSPGGSSSKTCCNVLHSPSSPSTMQLICRNTNIPTAEKGDAYHAIAEKGIPIDNMRYHGTGPPQTGTHPRHSLAGAGRQLRRALLGIMASMVPRYSKWLPRIPKKARSKKAPPAILVHKHEASRGKLHM